MNTSADKASAEAALGAASPAGTGNAAPRVASPARIEQDTLVRNILPPLAGKIVGSADSDNYPRGLGNYPACEVSGKGLLGKDLDQPNFRAANQTAPAAAPVADDCVASRAPAAELVWRPAAGGGTAPAASAVHAASGEAAAGDGGFRSKHYVASN